jgi:tRNA (cmo5U34)-methyltransferase
MKNDNNIVLEEMESFFDTRAEGYDLHMRDVIGSFEEFYSKISEVIPSTNKELKNLGCGTGLEIEKIFEKAPNAMITGIDLSQKMLDKLREKYINFDKQLELKKGSYFEIPLQENYFDYAMSGMTMHHFVFEEKLFLYKKIAKALKSNGSYTEGDYIETEEIEKDIFEKYQDLKNNGQLSNHPHYHMDIPFSIRNQETVIKQSGFSKFNVIWQEGKAAIYVATK